MRWNVLRWQLYKNEVKAEQIGQIEQNLKVAIDKSKTFAYNKEKVRCK